MNEYENILKSIRALATGSQLNSYDAYGTNNTVSHDIVRLLYQHDCFYLLAQIKQPHTYTKFIAEKALLNRICINERFHGCQNLFEDLDAAAIPYAVIKGAALSAAAYKDPYSRHSGDIDLLVSREKIDTVKQLLLRHGFIQGRVTHAGIIPFTRQELLFQSAMSHQLAPFSKATGNRLCPYIQVDLNTDIIWGESSQKTDMAFVLANTVSFNLCNITFKKLTPEMEFIAMCLHHYKDMNSIYLLSQGSLKLKLLCDIFFYLKNVELEAGKLYALCHQLEVSNYVYYCLYYTDQIFDDSALKIHLSALSSPTAKSRLNCFGLAENEIHQWNISFPNRLFGIDLQEYFQKTLPQETLRKIRMNKTYM